MSEYRKGTAGWYIDRAQRQWWRWRERRYWRHLMPDLYELMEESRP